MVAAIRRAERRRVAARRIAATENREDERRRKRWVEAAGELQSPLAPSAGLDWAVGFESDRRNANGAGAGHDGRRVRAEDESISFVARGFPDEDVVLDPLRGETVWGALDPDAAPPPARPATGDAWAWAREDARDERGGVDEGNVRLGAGTRRREQRRNRRSQRRRQG